MPSRESAVVSVPSYHLMLMLKLRVPLLSVSQLNTSPSTSPPPSPCFKVMLPGLNHRKSVKGEVDFLSWYQDMKGSDPGFFHPSSPSLTMALCSRSGSPAPNPAWPRSQYSSIMFRPVSPLRSCLWPSLSSSSQHASWHPFSGVRPRLPLSKWCPILPTGSEGPEKQEPGPRLVCPTISTACNAVPGHGTYSISATERMGSPVS